MNNTSQGVYTPSGRMGTALVLVPMAAVVASFILGVAYAYVDVYSPIVGYVSLIFVAVFGVALSWSISQIGLFAKCRNPGFMRLVGLGSGMLALYVSWATFTYALFARYDETFTATLGDVMASPAAIWEIAQAINAEGWYAVAGWTPTGMILWLFWGIEALIVVGAPVVLATMAIDDQVFCERCGLWCGRVEGAIGLTLPETDAQLQELRPDNLTPLETLQTAANRDLPHVRVDTWECGRCRNTTVLQLKMATKVTDSEGKVEEQTEDLTPMWSVTPMDLHKVQKLARRPPEDQQAVLSQGMGV